MRNLHALSYTFIIIGALNWGFVGFFGFDLIAGLFGEMSGMSRIIYSIIGISAIAETFFGMQKCKLTMTRQH